MPEKKTLQRARRDLRQGKSPTTAAGEFVREEIEHVREGKHGARTTKQAIAIGLSKARRAGVPLAAPKPGTTSKRTRRTAKRDLAVARKAKASHHKPPAPSRKRSAASKKALGHGKTAVSKRALSRQAKTVARRKKRS